MIEGLDKLNEQLRNLKGIKTSKSLLAGAYVLQRYSMENSPVRTGFLRQSHESVETENGAELRVNANYSYYVEFGTEKMPGQGFVRRSIDEHSDEVVKVVAKNIEDELRATAKGVI